METRVIDQRQTLLSSLLAARTVKQLFLSSIGPSGKCCSLLFVFFSVLCNFICFSLVWFCLCRAKLLHFHPRSDQITVSTLSRRLIEGLPVDHCITRILFDLLLGFHRQLGDCGLFVGALTAACVSLSSNSFTYFSCLFLFCIDYLRKDCLLLWVLRLLLQPFHHIISMLVFLAHLLSLLSMKRSKFVYIFWIRCCVQSKCK